MKMQGELGQLEWIYTGAGQAVVFLVVFLAVVVAYIALRMMSSA